MDKKCLLFIISILLAVHLQSYAVDIKPTPIQTGLHNSILLAAEDWKIAADENNSSAVENQSGKMKKSVFKAALYSALLPGLGEHYVGNKTKSKVFMGIEVVTWLSFYAFHTSGDWKKDDAIRFAATHANASLEDKDDEFFNWVGFYNSSEDFNSLGRVSDPDRAYLNSPDTYWQWSSEAEREEFRSYKNSSRSSYDRANFMIMAAISNRIISIIDAIRDAKRYNRYEEKIEISHDNSYDYKFSINPFSRTNQFSITLTTPF